MHPLPFPDDILHWESSMPTMYGICKTSSLGKVMNTVHNTQRRENNSQKMLDVNHDLPEAMDICAHDLIAMQAKENYNLLAIYSWDGNMTYAELNTLSSRLANYLASRGVGPEVTVPVCFEKSRWAIVSLLAVLRAGGTFVLFDISQPVARLKSIIMQTNAKLALSSLGYSKTCRTLINELFVVTATSISGLEPGKNCSSGSPQNAAYIIFTSGTTGEPKGVVIEHSQLSTSSKQSGQAMGFGINTRMLQFASYAFDASILEIITTLIFGGTICVPSEWERQNDIVNAMKRMEATCALFTPSLLGNLGIENVPTLITLIIGGESIPPSLVDFWASRLKVFLAYGPTECCVVCFISDTSQYKPSPAEIGFPIGCRAWIVKEDNYNELAESGHSGELLIEGHILARGYLNDISKTESQFIRNPTWRNSLANGVHCQSRFYRTGDLVKRNDNGTFCYVSRIDSQVKIRGQRLEVAEVERQLSHSFSELGISSLEQPLVEAIMLSPSKPSSILVAFIGNSGPESIGSLDWDNDDNPMPTTSNRERENLSSIISELEPRMRLNLPYYAIPSFYVPIRRFPLTISGKADRKRLRKIVSRLPLKELAAFSGTLEATSSFKVPTTHMEESLQALWAKAFGTAPSTIYADDNFFSLGGDSILAMRLVAASRAKGLDLTFETIFKHPRLSEMAFFTHEIQAIRGHVCIPPFTLLQDPLTTSRLRRQASEQCSVAESSIEDIYPSTATQSGLLAITARDPAAYIMQLIYDLPSTLDENVLFNAWKAVLARNTIIRTRFFEGDEGLLQVVIKEHFCWRIVRDKSLDYVLREEKARRISLGKSMSWHTLFQSSTSGEYRLIWTIHHSLMDGHSASKILSEVEEEYFGLPVQSHSQSFNRFIQHISTQPKEMQEMFWSEHLAGAQRPSFPQLPASSYSPHADVVLEHQVPMFSRPNITTATMLQAAWSLLLGMYSNSSDIVTGVTLNGRTAQLPNIENIIGPTITTVPFRTQWQPDLPAIDFLQVVQNQYLSIIPHEQLGLQNIKHLSADANIACDFKSLLVIQSRDDFESPRGLLRGRKCTFSSLDCALMMECVLGEKAIHFRATFDTQVLPRSQIERIFKQLEHILSGLSSSNSATNISHIQRICQQDVQNILAWNNANPLKVTQTCVHDLFKRRVETRFDAPAICGWDGNLSYRELDKYSSQLASYLNIHYNIRPESFVGVCFEKSIWVVVSMMAILKAGGACVPMDPKNPLGRLRTILQSTGDHNANLIITSALHADKLQVLGSSVLIVGPSQFLSLFPKDYPFSSPVEPSNAAIVVFTSGSSGTPKGIVIEHTSLSSSIIEHGSFIRLSPESRVLAFAAHSFDISIGDIFATLVHGGCICIPSEHEKMNNLSGAFNSLRANHVSLTATIAGYLQPEDVPGLKVLVVAGEPITKKVIETWADHVNLINMYGPAECTIYCIGKAEIKGGNHCSDIGQGVGARVWIVDPSDPNLLMPVGMQGELLIEGPTIARGYLDQEQTNSSFIEDPAWTRTTDSTSTRPRRFYRTGDLAFYNEDGSIAFVGRNDGQIKLRGQRLEISEVEYQLRECLCASVDVVASTATPRNGEKVLAAFLVVHDTPEQQSRDEILAVSQLSLARFRSLMVGLESKLHSILPSYMVPSVYIPICRLPLSTSGKIDRELLRNLASSLSFDQLSTFRGTEMPRSMPPSTKMEQKLCNLWKALLNTERIGAQDSFFRLGGDSVKAMRLVSLARKEGIAITISQIFKNPVLSELALIAREEQAKSITTIAPFTLLKDYDVGNLVGEAVSLCKVRADQIEDIYPAIPKQKYYILPNLRKIHSDVKESKVQIVFSLPSSLDMKRFQAAWDVLVHSIPTLRTRLLQTPSGIFQVLVSEPLRWRKSTSWKKYLQEESTRLIGFGDPLCSLCVVETSPKERYFIFSANHAAYDGYMLRRLFKQLECTYLQRPFQLGNPSPIAFLEYLQACDWIAARNFWATHLQGALPTRLCVVPDNYKALQVTEREKTFHTLNFQSGNTDVTLATLIYVAWALVISHAVKSNDIIITSGNSGRDITVPGIEDIMANVHSTIPLRISINAKDTIKGLLQLLHDFRIASIPFQHMTLPDMQEISPEIRSALDLSLYVSIMPFLDTDEFGREMGMKVVKGWYYWNTPFWVVCTPKDGEMKVTVYSDDVIISGERVNGMMSQFQCVLEQLMESFLTEGKPQKLEDIYIDGAENDSRFLGDIIVTQCGLGI